MHIEAGGSGEAPQIRTIVVYDGATGRVIHTHHDVTYDGAPCLPDNELVQRALRVTSEVLANARREIPSRLEALPVDPATIARGVTYRVDLTQRALVANGAT